MDCLSHSTVVVNTHRRRKDFCRRQRKRGQEREHAEFTVMKSTEQISVHSKTIEKHASNK